MEAGGHPEVLMIAPQKRILEACKDYKQALDVLKKFDDDEATD